MTHRLVPLLLLLGLALPGLTATAGPDGGAAVAQADEDEETLEPGVTGRRAPPVAVPETTPTGNHGRSVLSAADAAKMAERPYENVVYIGAEALGLPVEFVADSRTGLELIYKRDYKGAKTHFGTLNQTYPESAVGLVGDGLIWQALMLENFDFRYEPQYQLAFRNAKTRLEGALQAPGNDAWENFLMAGVMGIEAVHATRRGEFVSALSQGYEAMRTLSRARELAPNFSDLLMGDGLYNYWRSVVTLNSKVLPDFEDKRAEGIAQLNRVEHEGVFLSAPATMALTFTYMEEGDLRKALLCAQKNYRAYPDNVINNMLLARIHLYMRHYPQAENSLNEVLADAPDNQRAHYYLGLVYSRTRRLDQAIAAMDRYLAFAEVPKEYRSTALYRQGTFYYRKQQYARAVDYYEQAWKMDRHKGARRRLDAMDRMRKAGRISW